MTTSPSMVLNFTSGVLDPRVTFTRTQDATNAATYYNSSGVLSYATANTPRFTYDPVALTPKGLMIEETRKNLLTYSQDSSNAIWAATNTTKAISGIAPDGTSTATLVTASIGNAQHIFANSGATGTTAGLVYTLSVYAKKGTYNILQVAPGSAPAGVYANFDLNAGVVVSGSAATGAIISAGSGWYKCAVTFTSNSVANNYSAFSFVASTSATYLASYNAAGTETVSIWGSQLEQGAFATSYIPTVASSVQRGADNASMTGTNFSSWFNTAQGTILSIAIPYNVSSVRGGFVISDGTANNTIETAHGSTPRAFVNVSGSTQVSQANGSVAANSTVKSALAYQLNNSNGSCNGVVGTNVTTCTVPTVNQAIIGNIVGGASALNGTISKVLFYPTRLPDSTLKGLTS